MLLLRPFALVGAVLCLMFGVPTLLIVKPVPVPISVPTQAPSLRPGAAVAIIDVAPGVAPALLPELLNLEPTERVIAVDDLPVATAAEADMKLAERGTSGRYVDLTVASPRSQRRVLLLLH
jgi:hypothetical protein